MTAPTHARAPMPADAKTPDGFSLKRWSRKKQEAVRAAETAPDRGPLATPVAGAASDARSNLAVPATSAAAPAAPPLPPVESLTVDSDFTAFFQPKVDESLKRLALKKLFADPRFNVMDGLDVYIDDYSRSIPIPPEVLEQLVSLRLIMNPPAAPGERPPDAGAEAKAAPDSPSAAPEPAPEAAIADATSATESAQWVGATQEPSTATSGQTVADEGAADAAPDTPAPR